MSQVLSGQDGVVCNIDDILVHASNAVEHDRRLRSTLKLLASAGITLNKDKCEFRTQSVKFLGHIVDNNGIHADPEKIRAVIEMSPPRNVHELKSFLGMVNYHGKFIQSLATLAHPLNELLKSSVLWTWEKSQQTAFDLLKEKLSTTPILAKFDPSKETTVSSDASSYGIGAVLKQRQDDGSERPVAYASRSLNSTEQRYAQIEKEGLGLVWACERFRDYIMGIHIRLETNHKPLIAIFSSKMLDEITPRLQRMKLRLLRFSYDIFHTPGKQLIIADILSRKPLDVTENNEFEEEVAAYIQQVVQHTPMSDKLLASIREQQESDPILQDVRQHTREGWPNKSDIPISLRPYWQHRSDISEVDNLLLKGNRLIIPGVLKGDILRRIHEGHLGINKCRMKARVSVWWPGLSNEISDVVGSCDVCTKEATNHREPLIPSPSRLPMSSHLLKPYLVDQQKLQVTEKRSKEKQKRNYDNRHRASVLSELPLQKRVWITDCKNEGRIVGKANTPRSYIVEMENGSTVRRNRISLIPMRGAFQETKNVDDCADVQDDSVDDTSVNTGSLPVVPTLPSSQPKGTPASGQAFSPVVSDNVSVLRSHYGRVLRKPKKLEQYDCS